MSNLILTRAEYNAIEKVPTVYYIIKDEGKLYKGAVPIKKKFIPYGELEVFTAYTATQSGTELSLT